MRKRTIVIIFATLISLLCICVCIYRYNYPTHYGFKDRLILGSTSDEVINMYGDPDILLNKYDDPSMVSTIGYLVKPSVPTWWDKTWSEYYIIRFDDNGIAHKVEVVEWGFGG